MRANLLQQGVAVDAVQAMVDHRWANSTGSNLDVGWRQWDVFCVSQGWSSAIRDNPSAVHVVNFLAAVRSGSLSTKNRLMTAQWVRKLRSCVSIMVSMWTSSNVRIGAHPLVSAYIDAIEKEDYLALDRRVYRYDDTWDPELVFAYISAHPLTAPLATSKPAVFIAYISSLRDFCIALGRLLLACRSSDLACISREDCVRFERGDDGVTTGVSIRFYRPKERNSMPTNSRGYTRWVTIPAISDKSVCFCTLLREYVTCTGLLPRDGDALFVTERADRKHNGRVWALSSERLAKRMRSVMSLAGVPEDFMSHSGRHAGIALRKAGADTLISRGYQTAPWCDEQVMNLARMSARTYVTHYLRSIRAAELDEGVPPVAGS